MSNEEILKAFHLMWDNFPEAVMITQRSREIVAVNKKAAEYGLKAGVAKAEYKGKDSVKALADKVRAAGFDKAADEMEIFAEQEWHHGVVIDELLKKYSPQIINAPAQKTFVCSICGYEHVGDTPPEVCPVCGQPASVFKEKAQPKVYVCSICGYEHVGDTPPEVCPVCGQPASVFKEKA